LCPLYAFSIDVPSDRIHISNPGGLPKGLDEKDFGKYSLTRNSVLANLMLRANYIEKLGTGIKRIKQSLLDAGLQAVEFHFSGFFGLNFFRGGGQTGGQTGGQLLSENQTQIVNLMMDNPKITRAELSLSLKMNSSAIQKHIDNLKEMKIIKRIGGDFGGHWEIC
jgi:ATP-dependent DNA helicase RecG